MNDRITLNRVESHVADLPYPIARDDAAAAFDGVTVVFAEGEGDLGSLIDDCYTGIVDGRFDPTPWEEIRENACGDCAYQGMCGDYIGAEVSLDD